MTVYIPPDSTPDDQHSLLDARARLPLCTDPAVGVNVNTTRDLILQLILQPVAKCVLARGYAAAADGGDGGDDAADGMRGGGLGDGLGFWIRVRR